jgi:hypothetical protein
MYAAALYCKACGEAIRERLTSEGKAPPDADDESSYDSDDFPKGPFYEGGGESDSPEHCDACHEFLENPLTHDGEAYVLDAIERALVEGKDCVALTEWMPHYGIEPKDPRAIRLGRMAKGLRESADKKTGELDAYTSVGCYPLFYVAGDSDVVCPKCANDASTGLDAFGGDPLCDGGVNYEDPDLWCDCGERIPSAYAEDDVGKEVQE